MNSLRFLAKENIIVDLGVCLHEIVEIEVIVYSEKSFVAITPIALTSFFWGKMLRVVYTLVHGVCLIEGLRLAEQLQLHRRYSNSTGLIMSRLGIFGGCVLYELAKFACRVGVFKRFRICDTLKHNILFEELRQNFLSELTPKLTEHVPCK